MDFRPGGPVVIAASGCCTGPGAECCKTPSNLQVPPAPVFPGVPPTFYEAVEQQQPYGAGLPETHMRMPGGFTVLKTHVGLFGMLLTGLLLLLVTFRVSGFDGNGPIVDLRPAKGLPSCLSIKALSSSHMRRKCCEKFSLHCASERGLEEAVEPYDCDLGIDDALRIWSSDKKDWCCKHTARGCERLS